MVVKVKLTNGEMYELHLSGVMGLPDREFKTVAKDLCKDGFFPHPSHYISPHMIASVRRIR